MPHHLGPHHHPPKPCTWSLHFDTIHLDHVLGRTISPRAFRSSQISHLVVRHMGQVKKHLIQMINRLLQDDDRTIPGVNTTFVNGIALFGHLALRGSKLEDNHI